MSNIKETVSCLYDDQQMDVLKAEKRFFKYNGKGILFTNGTGTGKTYTGLGIARRFFIRGKKNILFVVPTDAKAKDLILALAVARKWPEVISNAVDPGWVPTKMGGSAATNNLEKGFASQVWLATGKDVEATRSGRLLYHKKAVYFNPQAIDEAIQEKFLSVCQQITGVTFS